MAVKITDKLITTNTKDQSQNIVLLIIAVLLVILYLFKEFYVRKETSAISISSYQKQTPAKVDSMSGEKHLIFSIPLDINKATAQDFEAIHGIGPKLANEIVITRTQLGRFKEINDLKKVKGIGDKKLEKMKEFLTIKDLIQPK